MTGLSGKTNISLMASLCELRHHLHGDCPISGSSFCLSRYTKVIPTHHYTTFPSLLRYSEISCLCDGKSPTISGALGGTRQACSRAPSSSVPHKCWVGNSLLLGKKAEGNRQQAIVAHLLYQAVFQYRTMITVLIVYFWERPRICFWRVCWLLPVGLCLIFFSSPWNADASLHGCTSLNPAGKLTRESLRLWKTAQGGFASSISLFVETC